jgi:hypothetical protein
VGLYSVVNLCRRAFVSIVIIRLSGACRRIYSLFVGCWVISYVQVGVESRPGLMGVVVEVVFLGCHPRDFALGVGGVVRNFLCVGALLVW